MVCYFIIIIDSKLKVQQIEKEKVVKTRMRMLMIESEQLQSSLRIRRGTDTSTHCILNILHTTGRKDALEDTKQEVQVLQDSISSVSVQLLPSSMCYTLYN